MSLSSESKSSEQFDIKISISNREANQVRLGSGLILPCRPELQHRISQVTKSSHKSNTISSLSTQNMIPFQVLQAGHSPVLHHQAADVLHCYHSSGHNQTTITYMTHVSLSYMAII